MSRDSNCRVWSMVLAATAFSLVLAAPAMAQTNFVASPGFEDPYSGWTGVVGGGTWSITARDAASKETGNYGFHLQITNNLTGNAYAKQVVSNLVGSYTLTARGGWFIWNNSKTETYIQAIGASTYTSAKVTSASGSGWKDFSLTGILPKADGTIEIRLYCNKTATTSAKTCDTYFDNVSLTQEAQANPLVTINQVYAQVDPTSSSPINYTVVFSEEVTGFTDSDVALSGTAGATTAVVTGSGAVYNVAVSGMTQSGTVIATIPAGVAQGSVGTNLASTSTDNTVNYSTTILNGLQNGGFESGTNTSPPDYWVRYARVDSPAVTLQTATPPEGARWAQMQIATAGSAGGIYQTATGFTVGGVYRISGSYKTNSVSATATVKCDTNGGVDYAAAEQTVATTTSDAWGTFTYDVTATGTSMTIFLDTANGSSANKAGGFDNIEITPLCDPAGTTNPSNAIKAPGETATFSVTGSGNAPTYQWEISTDSGANWSPISGATSASYTTDALTAGDNGNQYRCVVSVACDSSTATSAAATLTVVSCVDVTIQTQPTSPGAVCEGSTAAFSVVANGTAPIAYQWQVSTDGSTWNNVTDGIGATTSSYTTAATIAGMNGYKYRCVITNCTSGSVETNGNATLAVNSIVPTPDAGTATLGAGTITWNWGDVSGESGYTVYSAETGGTLLATLNADVTSWTEQASDPGTTYTRYVQADGACISARRMLTASTAARYCTENPDFESGFYGTSPNIIGTGWSKGTNVGTSTFASDSTTRRESPAAGYSQVITDPSGGASFTEAMYQKLNVQPNRNYQLRVYNTRVAGQAILQVGLNLTGGLTQDTGGQSLGAIGSWVAKDIPFTSGATGLITILLSAGYSNAGSTVYVDGVYLMPQKPATTGGTTTICSGGSATLTASGGWSGMDAELKWYTGPKGTGTLAGSGTSLTVTNITSTTTFYPRWEIAGVSGTCLPSDDGTGVLVTVSPATTITGQPVDQNVLVGGTATFTATGTGQGTVSYLWQKKNGMAWDSTGVTTSQLQLVGVSEVDAGVYRCVVSAGCGEQATNEVELTIAPTATAWSSVKTQGAAGTFAVAMDAGDANPPLIEPRRGDLQIQVAFSADMAPISSGQVAVKDQSNVPIAVALVSQPDAVTLQITLSNPYVGDPAYPLDGKRLTITLADTIRGANSEKALLLGDKNCQIRCLVGDVNQSGTVSTSDLSAVRDAIRPEAEDGFNGVVSQASCLFDANSNGAINVVDMALVRARGTRTVP